MGDAFSRSYRLHFAYGVDMNPDQIRSCCSDPEVVAVACLKDYEVGFFGYSRTWDGGIESIVPALGSEVWGVVYRLSFADGESLDKEQDVRIDGTGLYFHYPVTVMDVSCKSYDVLLYKKDELGPPTLPSREYLSRILDGAAVRGLPDSYIEHLWNSKARLASYLVPRGQGFRSELLRNTACSGCGDLRESKGGPGF